MMKTQKYLFRRRTLIVKGRFQYFLIFFFLMAGASIASIHLYFYQSFRQQLILLSEGTKGADPAFLNAILASAQGSFLRIAEFSVLFIAVVCGLSGLILSHRIAGPVYRTLKVIEQINQGLKVTLPIRLRSGDFFPELESALNELVKRTQESGENERSSG